MAGGLIGLLAIAALVLEGGTLLLNRRDAQNSADISSMAATRIVALNYTQAPKTQADVWNAIRGSLDVNDCPVGGSPVCVFDATFVGGSLNGLGNVNDTAAALPTGALGVRVAVTRQPGALLGRVLGQTTWTVTSEATAVAAQPAEFPGGTMLPIAVCGWVDPSNPNDCWNTASGIPTSGAARPVHRRPGLRPDRWQGRPGWFRVAVMGRLQLSGRVVGQCLRTEQSAVQPR